MIKSKTEQLVSVASMVSIHHLRPIKDRAGLVGPVYKLTGWGNKFICGIWYFGVLAHWA